MKFPSPDDIAQAPVWENYVSAQLAQASLGLLPESLLALGADIDGPTIAVRAILSTESDEDRGDLDDIVDEFGMLLGEDVSLSLSKQIVGTVSPSVGGDTWWTFRARLP